MVEFSTLRGTRVLVVEDDALLAMLAETTLAQLGCAVTGTATSVEAALAAIDNPDAFDCVILDVRLGQEIAGGIAGKLIAEDIPFVVCSGYSISLPGMNIPIVSKPYTGEDLGRALLKAMSGASKPRSPGPVL